MADIYNLTHLDSNLRKSGIAGLCFKYELSANKDCLHIVYLDKFLQEQFISVFRSSRFCYCVYCHEFKTIGRSAEAATKWLSEKICELTSDNEYMNVFTVVEFKNLDKITFNKKMELFRRLEEKKRERN